MTKTEFMSIGTRQKLNNLPSPTAIEINVTRINQVYSTKSLFVVYAKGFCYNYPRQHYNNQSAIERYPDRYMTI